MKHLSRQAKYGYYSKRQKMLRSHFFDGLSSAFGFLIWSTLSIQFYNMFKI